MSTSTLAALAARKRALVDDLAVSADRDLGALAADALVVEAVGDGLGLSDDAEARRGDDRDTAVALVLLPGDQRVHRRLEAEPGGVGRNVVDAAVGDQERTGDAVDRHVRQGRGQRAEQLGAVGLAVGLSGIDDTDLEPLDLLQAVDQRFLRLSGLAIAVAEILARALVDHDGGDRGEGIAVLAGEGGIGERQQEQRQRGHAHGSAARTRQQQHERDDDDRGQREPQDDRGNQRRECDAVIHIDPIAPAVRSGPVRAPGRPCSCRSACTSRCWRRRGRRIRAGGGRRRSPAAWPGRRAARPRRRQGRSR